MELIDNSAAMARDEKNSQQGALILQSTNRMQVAADGYVAAQKFCGIEWQVERAGAVLQSGRAGCAEF